MGRLKLCSATAFAALIGALYVPCASAAEQAVAVINRGVVEIETSGSAGLSVRIAEDLVSQLDLHSRLWHIAPRLRFSRGGGCRLLLKR